MVHDQTWEKRKVPVRHYVKRDGTDVSKHQRNIDESLTFRSMDMVAEGVGGQILKKGILKKESDGRFIQIYLTTNRGDYFLIKVSSRGKLVPIAEKLDTFDSYGVSVKEFEEIQ